MGFWVGVEGCCGHDGVGDAQGGGLFLIDWGIFDPVSFELSGEALVQVSASLEVGGVSGVR